MIITLYKRRNNIDLRNKHPLHRENKIIAQCNGHAHFLLFRPAKTRQGGGRLLCIKNIWHFRSFEATGADLRWLKWTVRLSFSTDYGEARWTGNLWLITRVRPWCKQTESSGPESLNNLLILDLHSSGSIALLLLALCHWIWDFRSTGTSCQVWNNFNPPPTLIWILFCWGYLLRRMTCLWTSM